MIEDVINAYRADAELKTRALIVLGPYMPGDIRRAFSDIGAAHPALEVIEFDNRMEELVAGASAVVAMGGYNTYCEILSFDKPALIVPRTAPRQEQLIRARRAFELGLVDMLLPDEAADAATMAAALKSLQNRLPPSKGTASALRLEGLPNICASVEALFNRSGGKRLTLVRA